MDSAAPLAAPLWDPRKQPETPVATAETVRRTASVSARPASQSVSMRPVAPAAAALEPEHAVSVRPVDRVPCGRCGELQAPRLPKCPRCGVADPVNAEPVAPRKTFSRLQIPRVPAVVAVVGVLALAGLTVYTELVKADERKTRIRQALGPAATEAAVHALEEEAERVGVSTDILLRVRFHCRRDEVHRPSVDHLATVARQAVRDGRDPGEAVAEAARTLCKR